MARLLYQFAKDAARSFVVYRGKALDLGDGVQAIDFRTFLGAP